MMQALLVPVLALSDWRSLVDAFLLYVHLYVCMYHIHSFVCYKLADYMFVYA